MIVLIILLGLALVFVFKIENVLLKTGYNTLNVFLSTESIAYKIVPVSLSGTNIVANTGSKG